MMECLESLRFHRSPLEPLLRLLPPGGSGAKRVEPEKDYIFHLSFCKEDWEVVQTFEFFIDKWSYGPYGSLPLYLSRGQESGREVGALLLESAGKLNSFRNIE